MFSYEMNSEKLAFETKLILDDRSNIDKWRWFIFISNISYCICLRLSLNDSDEEILAFWEQSWLCAKIWSWSEILTFIRVTLFSIVGFKEIIHTKYGVFHCSTNLDNSLGVYIQWRFYLRPPLRQNVLSNNS